MCQIRNCVTCKLDKPATNEYFYKDKNRPLGLMYRCKVCDKLRKDNRKWSERKLLLTDDQKLNKKLANRKYGKTIKGRAIYLLNAYRKEDKKKSRDFDLKQEDIINVLNTNCTYCGFPATGFDRLDNKIGHILINCIPSCKECNIARMDNFTYEETKELGKTIREIKLKRIS